MKIELHFLVLALHKGKPVFVFSVERDAIEQRKKFMGILKGAVSYIEGGYGTAYNCFGVNLGQDLSCCQSDFLIFILKKRKQKRDGGAVANLAQGFGCSTADELIVILKQMNQMGDSGAIGYKAQGYGCFPADVLIVIPKQRSQMKDGGAVAYLTQGFGCTPADARIVIPKQGYQKRDVSLIV